MIKQLFQFRKGSYSQKVKSLIASIKDQVSEVDKEHYDLTHIRVTKRTVIAIRGINEVKKHLVEIGDENFIEAYFAFSNFLIMCGGYNDVVDRWNDCTLSAAIWILDQLSLQGDLDKCYQFLSAGVGDKKGKDICTHYVNHPMYDYDLILSMVRLIRQRNTSKPFKDEELGTLQWDPGEPDNDEQSKKNRQAFDSVINLLSIDAIKHATDAYERDVWRFYQLSFRTFECIEKRAEKIKNEITKIENDSKEQFIYNSNPNPLFIKQRTDISNVPENFDYLDNNNARLNSLKNELEKLESFTLTKLSLANDREKTVKKLKKLIPDELAYELVHYHVDDPFESSFALLYLLDTDSDLPWFYYGSISVAYTFCDQLPYDTEFSDIKKPVLLSKYNSALYEHRYSGYRWSDITDASGEPVQREFAKNLGQLIYSQSCSLFPRVLSDVSSLDEYLLNLGDLTDKEKESYALMFYALHAGNLRAESIESYRLVRENKDEVETQETTEQECFDDKTELLKKEIKRLREKNSRLLSIVKENQDQKNRNNRHLELLNDTVELQKKELADLREKVFLQDHNDISEEPEDKTIEYPFYSNRRIVSFGGPSSWINEMKKKLPNVIFISAEMLPNEDLIKGADEIWIQTNCISHKSYYKIINTLKNTEKQLRYFIHPGVTRCAEQMVNTWRKN